MGVLRRYVFWEILRQTILVLLLFYGILLGTQFAKLLGRAASGEMLPQTVFQLLALAMVQYSANVLPVATFLGITLSLSRMYRDREMDVLAANGAGPTIWQQPVLAFALLATVLTAAFASSWSQWALKTQYLVRKNAEHQAMFAMVSPGIFRRYPGKQDVTLYVEAADSQTGALFGVLAMIEDPKNPAVIVAPRGTLGSDDQGRRLLRLYDGIRLEGIPGQARYRRMHFAEHGLQYDVPSAGLNPDKSKLKTTKELLRSQIPQDRAELLNRLSMIMAVFTLSLMAAPLAAQARRAAAATPLLWGSAIYVLYVSMLQIAQSSTERHMEQGQWFFVLVHGSVLGLALAAQWRTYSILPRRLA
jgi:lipopolysaccharide export system permease protein